MESDTLLSTQAAGDWLHAALPDESPAYWRQALINNRRTDRNPPHRIPFTPIGRGAFYAVADLQAFIEFEKSRRIGTIKVSPQVAEVLRGFGGTAQGRPFMGASATPQVANNGTGVFVQAIIKHPFMVFAMSPAQAIEFGTELIEVGQAAQRINGEKEQNKPDLGGYETVTDTPDILIMRRKLP